MRVLTVTTFFPNAAMPQRTVFVKNLVRAMRPRCAVSVIAPVPYAPPFAYKPEWRALRTIPAHEWIDGISVEHPRYIVLPQLDWLSGVSYFFSVLKSMAHWKRQLPEGEPAAVHVHCAYPDAVGAALAARLLRLPFIVTAHGSDINVYAGFASLRFQIRWALRHADGIIAVSGGLQEKILEIVGNDASHLCRIPCAGFDASVFRPYQSGLSRLALDIDATARVVVFVGLLVPIKGVELLLEAWAELSRNNKLRKGDRLVLLGDGPLRSALCRQVGESALDASVHFAGMVPQAEVGRWIAAANLLCLPSRNEGTPNVVVEALASGVPVVASRVGGVPDLVQPGQNGLLVPPGDAMALAHALDQALGISWDPERIARSVEHLTWPAIAEQNCRFLEATVEGMA